jgi:HAD superfamily hydrolase (TIGR01450 family)
MTTTLANRHDVALLDLDGVVYIGDHAVPGAVSALAAARAAGMRLAFVTNNAGRPPEVVADHLADLGIPATAEEVVTSAQAGADVLAARLPARAPVLAIGGSGVALALERSGLRPVRAGDEQALDVAAVLQGFGRDVAWPDLAAAARAVQRGAVWMLTNPDITLPMPEGQVPGNGSLARAVQAAAGRAPDGIAGKPHPALMQASITRTGAHRPLVVGDRLDTDIAGAARTGVASLLVLTGIADVAAALGALPGERPEYVGGDLRALTRRPAPTSGPESPHRDGDTWRLPGAAAWVDGGELRLECGDDWLAALQCGCAAAWAQVHQPRVDGAAEILERVRRTVES